MEFPYLRRTFLVWLIFLVQAIGIVKGRETTCNKVIEFEKTESNITCRTTAPVSTLEFENYTAGDGFITIKDEKSGHEWFSISKISRFTGLFSLLPGETTILSLTYAGSEKTRGKLIIGYRDSGLSVETHIPGTSSTEKIVTIEMDIKRVIEMSGDDDRSLLAKILTNSSVAATLFIVAGLCTCVFALSCACCIVYYKGKRMKVIYEKKEVAEVKSNPATDEIEDEIQHLRNNNASQDHPTERIYYDIDPKNDVTCLKIDMASPTEGQELSLDEDAYVKMNKRGSWAQDYVNENVFNLFSRIGNMRSSRKKRSYKLPQ